MDSKREVVIDCDPGIDDALALMLALGSKDIRVVGITVVCGNVGAALGTVNVCRILELMGRTDIPVIMGAAKPVFKVHGSAKATTVKNAIRLTKAYVEENVVGEISAALGKSGGAQ